LFSFPTIIDVMFWARAGLAALALLWSGLATAQTCTPVYQASPPALNACADEGRVSISLVGDVLLHGALQRQGYALGFDSIWGEAVPFLQETNIAVANLEGPVAPGIRRSGSQGRDPGAVFDDVVYTSYPMFNYNPVLLRDLKAAGVDLVSTANNHSLDRFGQGADATIDLLEAEGIAYTGTVRQEAAREFVTWTRSPLGQIAWIACTFSTNGIADRHDQVLMCYDDQDEVLALVRDQAARPEVGGVIVLTHWGVEYTTNPSRRDRDLARALVGAGAIAVVGTHPHVVQPWEIVPVSSGQVPVIYSTGNFVSGQPGLERETGMIARLELCRTAPTEDLARSLDSRLAVAQAGWIAVRMTRTSTSRSLSVADENGVARFAQPSHDLIERLVPGYGLSPRLACNGGARGADAALRVLLQ
jgi:hypothetical protein